MERAIPPSRPIIGSHRAEEQSRMAMPPSHIGRPKRLCVASKAGVGEHRARPPQPKELAVSAVNLAEKLSTFSDHWAPRVVAGFNGHDVMVVKVKGEFRWHQHDDTDDFFLVLSGRITIRMHEGDVSLGPGELFVVPKGVQHCPVADEEAHLLLIEPTGTPNTGDSTTAAPRVAV